MKILVTGAAGYIGAHVVLELLDRGFTEIYIIDNQLTLSPNWVNHLVKTAYDGNILSPEATDILRIDFDVVIHLAALISVEESVAQPVRYWRNNLLSTNKIIEHVKGAHLIFASTGAAFQPENPYAHSKIACEEEIKDRLVSGFTIFRFFNVSGMVPGVSATGEPTHLIRRAAMAARGLIPEIKIFGTDYDTLDGTCIRDYIHAEDVATSIVNAIKAGPANTPYECLGSGTGYSVMQVLTSMKEVSQVDFRVTIAERRKGDVASLICPSQYEHITLKHDLNSMCLSAYEGV